MKSYSRFCVQGISALLLSTGLLYSHQVLAQWGQQPQQQDGGFFSPARQFFNNFMSSWQRIPSQFPWDNVPQNPGSPGRPVSSFNIPPPVPQVLPPPETPPPNCLGAATLDQIYRGDCASANSNVPYVPDEDIKYEGTYCPNSFSSFRVSYLDGVTLRYENVKYKTPSAAQWELDKNKSQIEVNCSELLKENGSKFTVGGKALKGVVVFGCQSGAWRLKEMSCSDAQITCPGGTQRITFYATDGKDYPVDLAFTAKTVGTLGPQVTCTSLGTAGAGFNWAAGATAGTICGGTGQWQPNSQCQKVVATVTNVQYPNCTGTDAMFLDMTTKGLGTSCYTADGTKFHWTYMPGTPVNQCGVPSGC